jgi:serine/threonine protein phosphatase PrpC
VKFTIYQESRLGKRRNNEDRMAHCYSRKALLMVIADGMGGHYYGEIAAQIAVQTLIESFRREAKPKVRDPFLFLQRTINNAHHAISDFTLTHHLNDSPRTTCVACIIQENVAYWAHVGDSRLYFMRGGKILFRTRDHSRIQLLMDKGEINEQQAAIHPERNKIYSCLGGSEVPDISFSRKTPMNSGDTILLCTDGLWGVLPEKTMISSLKSDDLRQSVPKLLKQTDKEGGANADNFSVVAVRWGDSYIDSSLSNNALISTHAMADDGITMKLETFGGDSNYRANMSEKEIEQAVEEIKTAIQKYSK